MAKVIYVCEECGHKELKWMGCCSKCRTWNSFNEISQESKKQNQEYKQQESKPISLSEMTRTKDEKLVIGWSELDRVFGCGITKGSLCLLGGEPGIGKSTLLIQICEKIAINYVDSKVLYISGEESLSQLYNRSHRLKISHPNIICLNEVNWQKIAKAINEINPILIILDSIQTTKSNQHNSMAGSVAQVKEVTYELMNLCKSRDLSAIIIGHITKDGNIAGPKLLEHMVDTVISFEGNDFSQHRFLRVSKNRYGSTNEVGLFEMSEQGLKPIENPASLFSQPQSNKKETGMTKSCLLEGKRPLITEIQSLVVDNQYGNPKRTTQGYDQSRLSLLVAIIEKHLDIKMGHCDIYINTARGYKIRSAESDMAIVASLVSSYLSKPLNTRTIFLGEIGLTGEIKAVSHIEERVKEIYACGYEKVILPKSNLINLSSIKNKLSYIGVKKINELSEYIF